MRISAVSLALRVAGLDPVEALLHVGEQLLAHDVAPCVFLLLSVVGAERGVNARELRVDGVDSRLGSKCPRL